MLELNMLWKQEKMVWLICFPCTENSISLILRKSHALKKQEWQDLSGKAQLWETRFRPYRNVKISGVLSDFAIPNRLKTILSGNETRTFHAGAYSSVWFCPSCICSQSKDQKSVSLWGIKAWLLAYWGWKKWQTSEQNRFPKFLVLIFFLTCGQLLSIRLTGRAEGQISDVFMKTTQTPSPCILRVHNSALNCISEVRNSKCCQALFKPWSATDLY